ncbi:MAG: tRNA A-37 threonylcarbamoyl transferase component Bud32 [Akkermansiaceae bacterium]|jgi:tRNA A-37 threonylcarbamoyl transferase component Bud32
MPCFLLVMALHLGVLASSSDWLRDRKVVHQNDSNGGLLVKMSDGEVAKVFPDKGYLVGALRILLKRTKAHKQYSSMRELERLGVSTPKPLRVISFKPGDGAYEGALVYEYVEGVVEARDALKGELRGKVLAELGKDLIKMAKGGVLFVDFHLGNILVNPNGKLCWIDVEVRLGKGLVKSQFWSRVERMHRKCDPGVLTNGEWCELCEILSAALPGFKGEPSFQA